MKTTPHERILYYVNRRKKSRGLDKEMIHTFDGGEPTEASLLLSDLEALLQETKPKQEGVSHIIEFSSIRRHVEVGLQTLMALKDHPAHEEAVNWGDLHCSRVTYVEEDDQEVPPYFHVWICEANEKCPDLSKYISDYLEAQGHPGVIVSTEW